MLPPDMDECVSSSKILAIECSTAACSAALMVDGEVIERFQMAPRQHSDLILPMVESLLGDADLSLKQLDTIAFARGPGAFTGLRIAAGVVQGLAFGADLPVTPVSTLAVMAHGGFREFSANKILVANDASMAEVYYAAYHVSQYGEAELIAEEHVWPLSSVTEVADGQWLALGSGWQKYQEHVADSIKDRISQTISEYYPHAYDVACLAQGIYQRGGSVAAEDAIPLYLRDKVVGN